MCGENKEEQHNIFITDNLLDKYSCDFILNIYKRVPFFDVETNEHNDIIPKEKISSQKPWKYRTDNGVGIATIPKKSNDFTKIINKVGNLFPKYKEFVSINYMTIQEYPKDSCFPIHKDDADSMDSGTVIFFLNNNFTGGNLLINGHTILGKTGTMVAFDNCTKTYHSVEPIFDGIRYTLCIWFGSAYIN